MTRRYALSLDSLLFFQDKNVLMIVFLRLVVDGMLLVIPPLSRHNSGVSYA